MTKVRLPTRLVRNLGPGLILNLLALPLLWPLLTMRSFCTHDGNNHFFRLVALRDAIENGLWFSRWTPNLVYGYGLPFFNYRGQASYYIPELLILLGMDVPVAMNIVYAAALVLGGWGCWLLARDLWHNEWSGLLAAIAYLAAPYQMLSVYVRGNLPEVMALALLPWIWWFFHRLALRGGRGNFLAASFSLAALLLTHNISSLLFVPLLLAYLAFFGWQRIHQGKPWRHWRLAAGALLAGLLMTTFAWLPALAEKDSVQLYLAHSSRGNDFHQNFITLSELLSPPTVSDPSLLNSPLTVQVGLPLLVLALAGLAGVWFFGGRARRRTPLPDTLRQQALFMALAAAVLLLLTLPPLAVVWETLPLIRFVQFPWRLVGRVILPLALLAGAAPAWIAALKLRIAPTLAGAGTLVAVAVLILTAMPWLYPADCSFPAEPTIASVMNFERNTGAAGVVPLGTYLPRWVVERPAGSPMEEDLRAGRTPRRFDSSLLPDGARLLSERYGANRAEIKVETPAAFQALYHTFYFPGWRVEVDGEPVEIEPAEGTGLISFVVPAGKHTIRIRWTLTPLRAGAGLVSLLGLGLLLLAVGRAGRGKPAPLPDVQLSWRHVGLLILLAAGLLLAKFEWVDAGRSPLRRDRLAEAAAQAASLPDLTHPLDIQLDDGLTLLGYHVTAAARSDSELRGTAGEELVIDLAWTAREKPAGDYLSHLALVDEEGLIWSAKDTYRPSGYQAYPRTTQWVPATWAWDSHSIPILPGTPPGLYNLELTVFERSTLAPLNVLDTAGNVAGPSAVIGQVRVEWPAKPAAEITMQHTWNQQWGDLTLLGGNLDRTKAAPGDPTLVTLFWQAEAQLPALSAELALMAPDGVTLQSWSIPLVQADYPTTDWQVGDALMGQHLVQIPGRADDGVHHWQLTVIDADGRALDPSFELGSLEIQAPLRNWTAPAYDEPAGIDYSTPGSGDEPGHTTTFARLVGYSLDKQDGELTLELVWQALAETETSLRVFVHLLAADDNLVDQSDGLPADWTRPTSGWAPGEYIQDEHRLTIPDGLEAGNYRLAVGLYALESGDRLETTQEILTEVLLP